MTFDDGHALIELVKQGKFITFLPHWAVKKEPEISAVPLPIERMHLSTGVMWTNLSPATEKFLELATAEAARMGEADPFKPD